MNQTHQCREQHPYLARFRNDWATEAIAKQFVGNKHQHAYDMGWLEVPEKWAHLKVNASKRNPTGSRNKKALQVANSKKAVTKQRLGKGKGHVKHWAEEKVQDRLQFVQDSDSKCEGDLEDDDDDDDWVEHAEEEEAEETG